MSAADRHVGSWADSSRGAMLVALCEVKLDLADFVECQHAEAVRLEPVDPDMDAIDVELVYSEVREQWKAVLCRTVSGR